jgi:tRNA(Ile)-lysidine synthase
MAARELRHSFLAQAAKEYQARRVALGHHADDQVELFFLRLLRGAGAGGLAGMKWLNPSPIDRRITLIRPLLDQPKTALLDYARKRKIQFREDASNCAVDILRNRIRHKLLPFLVQEFQPALRTVILRQMEILGAEDDYIQAELRLRSRGGAGDDFEKWPTALQRRFIQHQLMRLTLPATFDLVEELRLRPAKKIMASPRLTVERNPDGSLHTAPITTTQFQQETQTVQLRGTSGKMVFAGRTLQWAVLRKTGPWPPKKAGREWFDADKIGTRIVLRHWRRGDRFQPSGMNRSVKLQDLFTNLKVPAPERRQRLVACTMAGDIWWVEGLRISERHKIGPETKRRLRWDYRKLTR